MAVGELFLILLVTVLLTWLFVVPLGRPGPWGSFLWFFAVLFLGTWAVAEWISPVGPRAWDVAWAPILIGALLIALLLAAVPPRPPAAEPGSAAGEAIAATVLGVFFWLLILGLVLVILLSFVAL